MIKRMTYSMKMTLLHENRVLSERSSAPGAKQTKELVNAQGARPRAKECSRRTAESERMLTAHGRELSA